MLRTSTHLLSVPLLFALACGPATPPATPARDMIEPPDMPEMSPVDMAPKRWASMTWHQET